MKWCTINSRYLDFLKLKEPRIPNYKYEEKSNVRTKKLLKPFFAVLFEHNGFSYVGQVSHPKERHYKLPESLDFIKLYHPNDNSKLLCVINLNYMFPVPTNEITFFNMKKIKTIRDFDTIKEENDYIYLLKTELYQINKKKVNEKAKQLYEHYLKKPNSFTSLRCLNFPILERECAIWTRRILCKNGIELKSIINSQFYDFDSNILNVVIHQSKKNPYFFVACPVTELKEKIITNYILYYINNTKLEKIKNFVLLRKKIDYNNLETIINKEISDIFQKEKKLVK